MEGTSGAPKSQFVTMNGKVYTYKTGALGCILEISSDKDSVTKINFPYRTEISITQVLGIQAAEDGNIWVMTFGFGKTAVSKFNLETKKMIQRKISVKPSAGSSGVAFVANGTDVYYADGTTIYRLKFNDDESLKADSGLDAETNLVDISTLDKNAGLLYNGLGIHPVTKYVYINSIKAYPLFTQNQIWAFDFDKSAKTPVAKYENYTNFPAGFFFAPKK